MPKLVIPLHLSNYAKCLYLLIYFLSLGCLIITPILWQLKIVGIGAITAYSGWIIKKTVFNRPNDLHFENGQWFITLGDCIIPVTVEGDSLLSRWVCMLHLKEHFGTKHHCLIFWDNVEAEIYRRLLVYLRFGCSR